ncbi:MAG: BolA family protein [Methylococcales bacterium]|jgi:BolA protein
MSVKEIELRLTTALTPVHLNVTDNSSAHAGHAGVQSGGGHYHVVVVAEVFAGKSLVQRHQLVYQALGDLMKQEIHALGIDASTPQEKQ